VNDQTRTEIEVVRGSADDVDTKRGRRDRQRAVTREDGNVINLDGAQVGSAVQSGVEAAAEFEREAGRPSSTRLTWQLTSPISWKTPLDVSPTAGGLKYRFRPKVENPDRFPLRDAMLNRISQALRTIFRRFGFRLFAARFFCLIY
jgi:hypothetical protein